MKLTPRQVDVLTRIGAATAKGKSIWLHRGLVNHDTAAARALERKGLITLLQSSQKIAGLWDSSPLTWRITSAGKEVLRTYSA